MNWPDVLAVVLVLLAALLGLRRGFWLELVLLLGVILAVLTSAWVTPKLSVHIPGHGSFFARAVLGVTFVVVALFFAGLYRWLAERTRGLVPDLLVPLDRVLGGLLGSAKGAAFAGLVFFVVLQPLAPARMRAAVSASHLARATVLLDAIALEWLAAPFPFLQGMARTLGESLGPQPHPAAPPAVVRERTGRNLNA
jgi:uncharacterized membrane protein required for colicin V production